MEIATEVQPEKALGQSGETTLDSNAVLTLPGSGKRSRRMDLSERDDVVENEEMKVFPKEGTGQREGGGVGSVYIWKTSLCSYFRRPPGGVCRHGEDCRYAHGEAELRRRPDNTWDPTSERAKKLLKSNNGHISSGVECEEEDATVDLAGLDKCLIGLPMKWASDKLKAFLDGLGISYKSAKKKKGMTVGFVSFEDAEHIKNAIEVLKENPLNCKYVKVSDAISGYQKKKEALKLSICSSSNKDGSILPSGDDVTFSTQNVEGIVPKTKDVCDVVTPLARFPYSDQLEQKHNSLLQTLKRLTRNARKACSDGVPLPEWILKSREIGGLPCKLEGILESPLIDGYRNKCEFSIGSSLEGNLTVGFMLGNFRNGVTAVEEPHSCPNISKISCKYALLFQNFLRTSELPVWNRVNNTGFWRQFTVREGRCSSQVDLNGSVGIETTEVMLIVQVCSLGYEEEISGEFNRMTQALALGASACFPPLPLTTIVVQDHKGISNAAPADCPLITLQLPEVGGVRGSGATTTSGARIHDSICNLKFSISPTAFFQVNTLAAERLYSLAGDWAELSPDTIVFDICCGTGTIGLSLAHRVGMVVGIEMNESAVLDADRNAKINGINNCRFICGKAEDVMGSILREYLDGSQLDDALSGDIVSKDAPNIRDETTRRMVEVLQHDAVASTEASASDPRPEEKLLCVTKSSMEKFAESRNKFNATVHQFKRVVAIVDPPRVGLHPTVIKALRTHPRIRRIVYISCNPETMVANAIELCTPVPDTPEKNKGNRGWRKMSNAGLARYRVKSMPSSEAFRPVKAMGVDLFPHTPHCEMVMLLER